MSKFNEWVRLGIIYPLAEKVKGTNSMEWYHRIQEMNTWSKEQIRAWQESQLHRIVEQAYNHTVYWRRVFDERGLKPNDIRTAEDIKKLPILTKADIRAHYEEMVPDNVEQFPHRVERTGGTTGDPMQYLVDEQIWGYVSADKIVAWRSTGYRFGDAFMALGSASLFQKKAPLARRVLDWIRNERAYNSMNMDGDLCRRYIEILEKQKIHYIYGYASSIYLLAKYALDNKIDMSHMRGAFTTSENLTDVYRETIEKAFGCRVMDCYGARDAAITAYEVTPGNYHLGYSALVEIVDEIAPNTGTLLSTNLLSMAFPVLRYDYGDVAELEDPFSQKLPTIDQKFSLESNHKNYKENTESSADTESIQTSINQQSANEQDSLLTSAQSRSKDIDAQYPSDDSAINTKNNISSADTRPYNGQVLHKIYGRVSDVLRLDNGHVLTSPGFTILMRSFDVKAYDIQKLSGSSVRMQVQVAEGWDKAQEAKLIAEMQRFVGEGCAFDLEYVDGFQELKNGKRRYFMNDLSADAHV